MKKTNYVLLALMLCGMLVVGACNSRSASDPSSSGNDSSSGDSSASSASGGDSEQMPVFSLAWSEYPSWSIFGVAHEMDMINGEKGELGEMERKYHVDVVLTEAGYDSCLNMFTTGNCDAVCMTNMDALIVSPGRDAVAVLPTSTSNGADACIVAGIDTIDDLKSTVTYGLEGTVSQYCFVRCLEEAGQNPSDFKFTNQDPGAAAAAMDQKQESHKSIMVWNPFVLQTLNSRPDAKVLFDSTKIPGEIVDMVVIGSDSLKKPGAEAFLHAVMDTFYQMHVQMTQSDQSDAVLVELGKKFSNLKLDDMKTVVQQTQFYGKVDQGLELLESEQFKTTMKTVAKFCTDQKLLENPQYAIGNESGAHLLFDASYLKSFSKGK